MLRAAFGALVKPARSGTQGEREIDDSELVDIAQTPEQAHGPQGAAR
ncbi:hypothetical protein ACFY0R_22755 [Streptomyces sp. NPDC001633]